MHLARQIALELEALQLGLEPLFRLVKTIVLELEIALGSEDVAERCVRELSREADMFVKGELG